MKSRSFIYDYLTGETRIEENEIEETIEEIPTPQEPTLEEQIKELQEVNQQQDELINITMMATDEMYMMIEPLLINTYNLGGNSKSSIVNLYATMIKRKLKNIEDVPISIREYVKDLI